MKKYILSYICFITITSVLLAEEGNIQTIYDLYNAKNNATIESIKKADKEIFNQLDKYINCSVKDPVVEQELPNGLIKIIIPYKCVGDFEKAPHIDGLSTWVGGYGDGKLRGLDIESGGSFNDDYFKTYFARVANKARMKIGFNGTDVLCEYSLLKYSRGHLIQFRATETDGEGMNVIEQMSQDKDGDSYERANCNISGQQAKIITTAKVSIQGTTPEDNFASNIEHMSDSEKEIIVNKIAYKVNILMGIAHKCAGFNETKTNTDFKMCMTYAETQLPQESLGRPSFENQKISPDNQLLYLEYKKYKSSRSNNTIKRIFATNEKIYVLKSNIYQNCLKRVSKYNNFTDKSDLASTLEKSCKLNFQDVFYEK